MTSTSFAAAALGVVCVSAPLLAHHSFAAQYDDKKTVTLKGIVTKFDWANPHVFFFTDVTDAGGKITNWAVEWDSRIELKRAGWKQDSLKVGDAVTVEGNPSKDGSKQVSGKTVTLANGKKLSSPAETAPVRAAQPAKPTPRWPDGHVRLGIAPGQIGYWANASASSLVENSAPIRMN